MVSAVPEPVPGAASSRVVLTGDLPSPIDRPSGCHFQTRCPFVTDQCRSVDPPLREVAEGHRVACHLVGPSD